MSSRRAIGALQVVLSAIGYGCLGVLGKNAFAVGMKAGDLLALRFVLATSLLWLFVFLFRRDALRINRRQFIACATLGVFGYAVFSTLFFHALEGLSVSLLVLLLYTYPVMVAAGAFLVLRERITIPQLIAMPIVAIGLVMLLAGDIGRSNRTAVVLALAAALFYAAYVVASSRLLRSINPLSAGLIIVTTASVVLSVLSPLAFMNLRAIPSGAWVSIVGLAVFSTVCPMILFLSGLEKLTSTEASLLSTIEPVTATTAAALVLHESLRPIQIAGGVLILLALIVSSLRPTGAREHDVHISLPG